METDEKVLVNRARDGDHRAFEVLVRKYQSRVFRVAMGILRNEDDALDIAQEAFVKAHRNLERFKGDSAFYTWMHRITSNLCIDFLRRRRGESVEYDDGILRDCPEGEVADVAPTLPVAPVQAVLDRELGEKLSEALESLSDAHRQILVLREIEGLSYEEIAQVLGIRKGTVMSRLFHARKNMQTRLRAYLSEKELVELMGESVKEESLGCCGASDSNKAGSEKHKKGDHGSNDADLVDSAAPGGGKRVGQGRAGTG